MQDFSGLLIGRWHNGSLMNEGEACTRSWVFLNIGWRTEDRNFSERGNSMQHILNPHSILPYWVIHTGQTETEMPVWCALLYNHLRWRFWNLKYVQGKGSQSSFCKAANKMKWKSYTERKRRNPNFPRQNSFNFKGC